MPTNTIASILKEQTEWKMKRTNKSTKEYLYKR